MRSYKSLLSDAKLLRSVKGSPVFQSLVQEGFNPLLSMMDRKEKVVQELVRALKFSWNLIESPLNMLCRPLGPRQVTLADKGEKRDH